MVIAVQIWTGIIEKDASRWGFACEKREINNFLVKESFIAKFWTQEFISRFRQVLSPLIKSFSGDTWTELASKMSNDAQN